jgi:hypothetical protein
MYTSMEAVKRFRRIHPIRWKRMQFKARMKRRRCICRECGKEIPYPAVGRKRHPECQRNFKLRCARENRKKAQLQLDRFKLKRGCAGCGYKKCAAALDFHHVDSTKKERRISALQWKANSKITQLELAKCILLCANCHREEHHKEEKQIESH